MLEVVLKLFLWAACAGLALTAFVLYLKRTPGMFEGTVLATGTEAEKQAFTDGTQPPTNAVSKEAVRKLLTTAAIENGPHPWAADYSRNVPENGPRYPSHVYRVMANRAAGVALTARGKWPPFYNAHDALGHLLEEVHELEAHVFTKEEKRDLAAMKKEALDVAACAIQLAVEICNEERGRR